MPILRAAAPPDVAAVVALWERAAGPTRHRPAADDVDRLIARDPDALILAVDDESVVGTIVVGWDGWRAHLYRLCVAPEHRRRGVAGALVAAAADRVVALGAVRLDAMVHTGNDAAIAFWRRAGFRVEGADERWSLVPAPATGEGA